MIYICCVGFASLDVVCDELNDCAKYLGIYIYISLVDGPRWSDGTDGQMDGEAGWWTSSGRIGLLPISRVKRVGRQQHIYSKLDINVVYSVSLFLL